MLNNINVEYFKDKLEFTIYDSKDNLYFFMCILYKF